jgi:hypothetical protein
MRAAKIEGRPPVYLRDDALRQGPLFFACRLASAERKAAMREPHASFAAARQPATR